MSLRKMKNQQGTGHSDSLTQFRTIIKSRVNKQTIKEIVNLSASLQQSLQQDDKRSMKSFFSKNQRQERENNRADKLRSFVRNMKSSNLCKQSATIAKIPLTTDIRELGKSRGSMISLRSSRSRGDNLFSMNRQKDMLENQSMMSTKSLAKSQIIPRSKTLFGGQVQNSTKQRTIDKLNKMEDKINYLVRNKLKNLMLRAQSKNRYIPKPMLGGRRSSAETTDEPRQENLLEKQMQTIIDQIAALKQKDSDQAVPYPQIEQNIIQLDKKIQLLQKIIASNFTESQILRKFYFGQKSQKYPHLSTKQKILESISKRKDLLRGNYSCLGRRDLNASTPILNYESTSKHFYTKPSKAAYLIDNNRMKSFVINRQPMPRSSYGRQFLNYGTLPVFKYKPYDKNVSSSKLNIKTSSYQESFKDKDIQLKQLNYKELDCFKDKFKIANMSFAQIYKNNELIQRKAIKQSLKNSLNDRKQNKTLVLKTMQTLGSLQQSNLSRHQSQTRFMGDTQMKRQFIWHSKSQECQGQKNELRMQGISSVIKNENLDSLKAAYKTAFLR